MLNLGFRCIVRRFLLRLSLHQTDETAEGQTENSGSCVPLPRVPQPTVFFGRYNICCTCFCSSNDDNIADIDVVVPPTTTSTTCRPLCRHPTVNSAILNLDLTNFPIEKVTGIAWLGDVMFASTQPGPIFKIDGETTEVTLD